MSRPFIELTRLVQLNQATQISNGANQTRTISGQSLLSRGLSTPSPQHEQREIGNRTTVVRLPYTELRRIREDQGYRYNPRWNTETSHVRNSDPQVNVSFDEVSQEFEVQVIL